MLKYSTIVIASVTWPKRPFFRAETVENTVTKNQQLRGPFLGRRFLAKQSFDFKEIASLRNTRNDVS
jgi:hypothetical protein